MTETLLKSRIVHKHDIEANWQKASGFYPKQGEIIVYDVEVDKDGNAIMVPDGEGGQITAYEAVGRATPYTYERFKIGDGIHNINDDDLPFANVIDLSDYALKSEIPTDYITDNDLTSYQTKIDENLETDSKEIVGAINELNAEVNSMLGEWVFNDEITAPPQNLEISFVSNSVEYRAIEVEFNNNGDFILYYSVELGDQTDHAWGFNTGWYNGCKNISILIEPSAEVAAWIKANAKKKQPVGVEEIGEIYTNDDNCTDVYVNDGYSIDWSNVFGLYDKNGYTISSGFIAQSIPLAAGKNVEFEVDEESKVVKINAEGGSPQTSITYSELKALRDNSELVPGMFYRIIDYQCTTTQENTRAMNNLFDIIIQALDVNKLSENASATWAEGTDYFADVNLAAWELKYSLDNDTSRFAWADEENGKGVIYYMKDENNNECPYDFKNITYLGSSIIGYEKYGLNADTYYPTFTQPYLLSYFQWGTTYAVTRNNSLDQAIDGVTYYGYNCSSVPSAWSTNEFYVTDNEIASSSTMYKITDGVVSTISYGGNLDILSSYDISVSSTINNNIIREYKPSKSGASMLNSIVFIGNNCYYNTFGYDCHSNTFGNYCYSNTFGNYCYGNTFGNYCYSNTFGNDCYNNTFGDNCHYNTFGDQYCNNTFGSYCYSNTFGDGCDSNTFGNECNNNTFGVSCCSNTFSNDCYENAFGNECVNISFDNGCVNNTLDGYLSTVSLGKNCSNNRFYEYLTAITFADYCSDNEINSMCDTIKFDHYCRNNTIGTAVYSVLFGSNCNYNNLGNDLQRITFESSSSHNLLGNPSEDRAHMKGIHFGLDCEYIKLFDPIPFDDSLDPETTWIQDITVSTGVKGTESTYRELQVSRNAAPVVFEAANTTHIILD